MKVIGLKHLTGVYNDNTYDNYNIYAIYENDKDVVFGVCPSVIKVKAAVMNECINDVNLLLNADVDFYYDSYKNVVKILVKE